LAVNYTFFPQHFLGLSGIPRRYYDYADFFWFWHEISRLGSFISFFSLPILLWILYISIIEKKKTFFQVTLGQFDQVIHLPPTFHRYEVSRFSLLSEKDIRSKK
jgi:heme/copper-type cytochrome/quinol oxidase subunit 1